MLNALKSVLGLVEMLLQQGGEVAMPGYVW